MKEAEIDAMEAGHDLDRLVAEKVMGCAVRVGDGGWHYCDCPEIDGKPPHGDRKARRPIVGAVKQYSTKIAAAWLIVEKLNDLVVYVSISTMDFGRRGCFVTVVKPPEQFSAVYRREMTQADTFPLAICRAALKAVFKEAA